MICSRTFHPVASVKQQGLAGLVTLLLFAGASSCKPTEPAVGTVKPVDASTRVRAIQVEEERQGREVQQIARSQVGREPMAAEKLGSSPQLDAGTLPMDGGHPSRAADSQLNGKLEQATTDQLVIRDKAGFEYWLRAGDSTQVTANGKPARLTDIKQGTDVRAEFFWDGRDRIATAVDAVADAPGRDGGSLGPPNP
ncbi:MAG TPA: hypothetical protein VFV14_03640 [Myxococcaceae bacterium]|nr:hypothetical protein [Myxococcaceae bacterium]